MAKKVNLIVDQGSTFSAAFELLDEFDEPLDLSAYTARGQMRKHYSSNTAYPFTCSLETGELVISIDAVQTANISPERYVYDIELVDASANSVVRIVEGFVTVTPEVTK